MEEHNFSCPYCWQIVSMMLDSSVSRQSYIEDCEVCCNPTQISVTFFNTKLIDFQATSIEQ